METIGDMNTNEILIYGIHLTVKCPLVGQNDQTIKCFEYNIIKYVGIHFRINFYNIYCC